MFFKLANNSLGNAGILEEGWMVDGWIKFRTIKFRTSLLPLGKSRPRRLCFYLNATQPKKDDRDSEAHGEGP